MIKTTFSILLLGLTVSVNAQWQQCIGSENLDVQALHVTGNFDFFGGASGTYRSLDQSTSYSFSNSGNDSVGPTRGIISDGNYIYTCTLIYVEASLVLLYLYLDSDICRSCTCVIILIPVK